MVIETRVPLRTAQCVQMKINLPILRRVIKIDTSVTDQHIVKAMNFSAQKHPLSSVALDLSTKSQFVLSTPWPVEWKEMKDETEALLYLKYEPLKTEDMIIRLGGNTEKQIHQCHLTVVRCIGVTYISIAAPHTIVDGYGINAITRTFISALNNEDVIFEVNEIEEYKKFVESELFQQDTPCIDAKNFWLDAYSSYEPLPFSKIKNTSANGMCFEFTLSECELKILSDYFIKRKASMSTGILTAFSIAFSHLFDVNQLAIRMTDNQRRTSARKMLGGYFAEDYALFMKDVKASDFYDLLRKTAEIQSSSLRYIGSFRHFDYPDKKTTDIKFHFKNIWSAGRFHPTESVTDKKNSWPMNMAMRVNAIPKYKDLRIQLLCNENYFTNAQGMELKSGLKEQLKSIINFQI